MGRFIDLSHQVVEGMETYRPLPTPVVEVINNYDASVYEGKSEFLIASLHLCGNTGTYVDSPRHRFRAGVDLAPGDLGDGALGAWGGVDRVADGGRKANDDPSLEAAVRRASRPA